MRAPLELCLPEFEQREEDSAHDGSLCDARAHAGEEAAHSLLPDSLLEHLRGTHTGHHSCGRAALYAICRYLLLGSNLEQQLMFLTQHCVFSATCCGPFHSTQGHFTPIIQQLRIVLFGVSTIAVSWDKHMEMRWDDLFVGSGYAELVVTACSL